MRQINIDVMAKELGLRPDQLRLQLGIPTKLQREIRATKNFQQISSFASVFNYEERLSCGPKFEPQESGEYARRRAELFPAFLAEFTTVEQFVELPSITPMTSEERVAFSEKLESIFGERVKAASTLKELASLRELMKQLSEEPQNYSGISRAFHTPHGWDELHKKAKSIFQAQMKEAKTVKEAASVLQDASFTKDKVTADLAWALARNFKEVFFLEGVLRQTEHNSIFGPCDRKVMLARLLVLLKKHLAKTPNFTAALIQIEHLLASRDQKDKPDEAYTLALELMAEKISTEEDLKMWLSSWNSIYGRRKDKWSHTVLPDILPKKWDEIYLSRAETESDMDKLKILVDKSSHYTKTREVAGRRYEEYRRGIFQSLVAPVKTIEQFESVKKKNGNIFAEFWQEAGELGNRLKDERARELLNTSNDKTVLIGLFHHFDDDAEARAIVLRKLLEHYPAETVDEIAIEVK